MRPVVGIMALRHNALSTSSGVAAVMASPAFACAVAQQHRCIQFPPGGFEEPLPSSFGRQSGKGELSSVNLRTKQQKARRMRQGRRKLRIPSQRPPALTLAKVKGELLNLIEQTRDARGEALSRKTEEMKVYAEDRKGPSELGRALPADVAGHVRRDEAEDDGALFYASRSATPDVLEGEGNASVVDRRAATTASIATALTTVVPSEDAWPLNEEAMERRYSVRPMSTIFGGDLDRLERDMMREYHQRGSKLPPPDRVYTEFGAGQRGRRMQWEPSSSFDYLVPTRVGSGTKAAQSVGDHTNRNLAAYHMYAEAYQVQREEEERRRTHNSSPKGRGINLCHSWGCEGTHSESDLPASENPHFPAESTEMEAVGVDASSRAPEALPRTPPHGDSPATEIVINARTDYKARLSIVPDAPKEEDDLNRLVHDAYHQRPTDNRLLVVRGADYWADYANRKRVEERSAHRQERIAREVLQEGAVDTSEVDYSTNKVRKETLLYYQSHPVNEMIQEPFVRIRQFMLPGGGSRAIFNPMEPVAIPRNVGLGEQRILESVNMDVDIPVQEARRMAQELGLDLIRIGALYSQKTDRRIIALCLIGDHREHLRDMVKFKIQKLDVQPPPTKECIEVPFKGGTHPHAIRFKCVGVAKHILHRHAIRINLTKFGTPREGFPVFQSILDELKLQCMRLKAYHTAGAIQSNYNEIFCYLFPSTGRSPKTTVAHPSPQEVLEARDESILAYEKEVYFDDLQDKVTQKERLQYMLKLENGTAWAEKDDGLSLQRQRAIKVMLGYLPKGNREIYAARGDVNVPAPFRASHPTSVEKWTYPTESNLEQASRGAAAIGKRAAMPISEMHDAGETPENPTQLDRFYYTAQGPALEMGSFKEALGLKDNRQRRPPMGSGFATLGVGAVDRDTAASSFVTK